MPTFHSLSQLPLVVRIMSILDESTIGMVRENQADMEIDRERMTEKVAVFGSGVSAAA